MSSRSSNSYPEFPGRLRVGFVRAAFGIRGEVFIKLFAGTADWLDRIKDVQVLTDDATTPRGVRLVRARSHKDGLVATLAGVDDRNAAEALAGAQIYIPSENLVSEPGEAIYLREILGFELRDPRDQCLGHVSGFSSNGPQDLLIVARGAGLKDALVPFIETFVTQIDFDKRVVRVDLPPGLITLGD